MAFESVANHTRSHPCRALRYVEAGYVDNPYHSATHAADVLQTLHVIIHGAQLHVHYLDPLGLFAAYWAAVSTCVCRYRSPAIWACWGVARACMSCLDCP